MPVQSCESGGRPGWRWGASGHCYTYAAGDTSASNEAKRKAHVQGYAATQHGAKALDTAWIDDPALWADLRAVILPVVEPLFRDAFITGAEMGAMQQPARARPLAQEATDLFATGIRALDPQAATVLPYDFDAILKASDETIGAYTDEWWSQFSASTQRQLRALIQRAERTGMTTADVARELEPVFGAVRAQRIAVSELTNLMGMGAQETYKRAGYSQWEWRTVQDSKVDEICRRRSRQRFPMSLPFRRAHVHCRCWPVPAGPVAVQPTLLDLLAS